MRTRRQILKAIPIAATASVLAGAVKAAPDHLNSKAAAIALLAALKKEQGHEWEIHYDRLSEFILIRRIKH